MVESAPVPATVTKRPGRNFVAAVGVGVLFGAVVLALLYFAKPFFLVLVAAFGCVGVWEFGTALAGRGIKVPLPPLYAVVVADIAAAYFAGLAGLALATAGGVLLLLTWRMITGVADYVRDVTAAVCVAVYVPLLLAFVSLLLAPSDGAHRVLVFIAAVFASDTGGLAVGALIGRHGLAPVISPKKSWEGLAGSLVLSAAVSGWLVWWLLDSSWWYGAVVGVVAALVGTLGDLVESVIKRDLGIKDMSSLLPGHGGVMDRLDSLAAAAPFVWLALTLLAPPG
ncbi:MAG: phosphatidate cytidylyltransferase [Streptosporangiales bacterium]|nr:phosphatidate cytidylyltransferase [Streptosporangiales bacterium]